MSDGAEEEHGSASESIELDRIEPCIDWESLIMFLEEEAGGGGAVGMGLAELAGSILCRLRALACSASRLEEGCIA